VFYSNFESRSIARPGGGTVGLIRFNLWMIAITQPFDQAIERFRNADGIIIDLRGNLGGLAGMILGLSGHFLKERVSLGTLKMRDSELHFFTNPRLVNPAGERVEPYAGPVAILIDDLTMSAGEIFAGGMQAVGRARLFGETTGGQALPAIWDKLPNGDLLYHAFGDFVTASGARVEGKGVEPDEIVPLKRADLLGGRDAAQAAAIRWIEASRRQPNAK
jgi:carboxyl-terminal processing protease